MRTWLALTALIVVSAVAVAGCGLNDSGPRKVVITESVCSGIDFLRLQSGEETRLVVDNTNYSEDQSGLSLSMVEFPGLITSEYPEGAQTGPDYVTFEVAAERDEENEVTVIPTFVGQFQGLCNITVADPGGGGGTVVQRGIVFQVAD